MKSRTEPLFLLVVLLLSLTFPEPTTACANTYYTSLDGASFSIDDDPTEDLAAKITANKDVDWKAQESFTTEQIKAAATTERWKHESDLATIWLRLGRAQESVKILERLAKEHPNEYTIAANLGTAYELLGNNDAAHLWIKRGMDLNPESHQGTEWLHLKILEAKTAMKNNPLWLQSNSVLDIDFGTAVKPKMPVLTEPNEWVQKVQKALVYQLRERISFVAPPDPIVGDLLFDFANLTALTRSIESAKPLSQLALKYGPPKRELAEARDREYTRLLRYSFSPTQKLAAGVVGVGAAGIVALLVLLKWLRKKQKT